MENKKDLESKEGLSDFFSDLGDDDAIDSDYDEIDMMSDETMQLLENYGNYSGGIITFDTIYTYLQQGNFPKIQKSDCFELISRLRTNEVIHDEIVFDDLPEFYLYIFKDITISPNGVKLIKIFAQTPQLTLQAMKEKWTMEESVLTSTIENLHNQKLLLCEDNLYNFPAIKNK
jgi:hypothetical protein